MTKSRNIIPRRIRWTAAQDCALRRLYATTRTSEIAEQLGRTVGSTYQRAQTLRLHKDVAMLLEQNRRLGSALKDAGAPFRFAAGHVPANKGLRRPGYAPGRMRETQFKKGQRPHTWMPIGSRRLMDGYLQEKVTDTGYPPRDWVGLHILLWRRAGRRVPKRHVLAFKNGDRTDVRLSNLECIHRRELSRRNHWKHLPKPLRDVIVLRTSIKATITKRLKHGQHHRGSAPGAVRDTAGRQKQGQARRPGARQSGL